MPQLLLTNSTPGGRADPIDYTAGAVTIAAGASLNNTGSNTVDTKKITFSGWFRAAQPPLGQFTNFYYFNKIGDFEGPNPSRIFMGNLGTFEVWLHGHTIEAINDKAPFLVVNSIDADPAFDFDEWNHIYVAIDVDAAQNSKIVRLHLNGDPQNLLNLTNEQDSYPESNPHEVWDVNLTTAESGAISFLHGDATRAVDVCDVMVWHGQFINPVAGTTSYTAKAGESFIIRDAVNYANSRGVDPVDALAAMFIETIYGTYTGLSKEGATGRRNLYQFLNQGSYNAILGYTGQLTKAADQYTAFCNAWTGLRPNGTVVANPNNYHGIVRSITSAEPEPHQKFLMHVLGGSAGVTSQVNGHNLLTAWVADENQQLSAIAPGISISNMTAQTSIWGSTGPMGLFTTSNTVAEAVEALEQVWTAAEADALTHLDAGSTSNLAHFIDGDGLPMPPSVAIEAFGTPTFLFTGNAAEFVVNGGTGGTTTATGSITDTDGPA